MFNLIALVHKHCFYPSIILFPNFYGGLSKKNVGKKVLHIQTSHLI